MLTNNKKSFFVKGIAMLMAMLMVLAVCLTGCGKAAEEAQKTADQAVADAAAAQSAADAVKKELEKYFTSEETKTEAGKLIEEALKPYATTEALAAFVKSEDFEALVAQLNDYVKADALNAAITEALEGKVTGTELEAVREALAADIKKNQTSIADAVASLKDYATDAEIAAIKTALENKIAATDAAAKEAKEALKGYLTAAQVNDIKAALEKKIADGDAFAQNALKDYVKAEDLSAIQTALNDKIAATDKAVANAVASLKDYVKADEYALLVSSVQEMTFKLQTIDRDHYVQIMQELAPYIEDQEALAESVKYLADELANIDNKHHNHIVELLADYVATADYENLVARVQALDTQLSELHMNVKNELTKYVTVENFELLTARVEALAGALEEIRVNANAEIAALTNELGLVEAAVQRLDVALTELHENVRNEFSNYVTNSAFELLTARVEAIAQNGIDMGKEIQGALVNYATKEAVDALEGRVERLEEVVRAILDAFYTKEEVETLAGEGFEDLLDMPAASITVLIKDKMGLEEWTATTTEILTETLAKVQELLEKLYADADGLIHNYDHYDAYLYARKMAINKALAPIFVVVFDPADGDLNDSAVIRKGLEYAVLRAANNAQLLNITNCIQNALDVNNFAEDLLELYQNHLYTIGCATEHNHKGTQVVTIEHKAQMNNFADKFDDLIISYLFDTKGNAFEDTKYMVAGDFGYQPTMGVYKWNLTGALYTFDDGGVDLKMAGYTKVDDTIIFDGNGLAWKTKDHYGLYYLPTDMVRFQYNGAAVKTVKLDGFHGSKNDIWVANGSGAHGTYWALIKQSKDAQDLVDLANAKFQQFLNNVVKAYGKSKAAADFAAKGVTVPTYIANNFYEKNDPMASYANLELKDFANIDAINDIQFLYALTVDMCTPVFDPTIGTNGGIIVYDIYLTGENSVQSYMTAALTRNTCLDSDHKARNYSETLKKAIYRYDLYAGMIDKAWYLCFELYRTYANEMTVDILNDYISVLDYAIQYPDVDANLDTFTNVDDFLNNVYDVTKAEKLTAGFLAAFLNGTDFGGWASKGVEGQESIQVNNANLKEMALKNYYTAINKKAVGPDGKLIEADPIATINAVVKSQTNAEYIRQYLHGASIRPQLDIWEADREAAKAEHYDDIAFVFEEILNKYIADLDEIYNRFLLEDYQKMQINKAWAFATQEVDFFCLDTDKAPLTKAMQNYLTSADASAAKVTVGGKNFLFKDLQMNEGEEFDGQLPNGSMYTKVFSYGVDIYIAPQYGSYVLTEGNYAASATNIRDLLNADLAWFETRLTLMAVKYNFLNYLDDASQNLARAQLNYSQPMRNGVLVGYKYGLQDMINGVVSVYNSANTSISILKFQEELGQISFNTYLEKYEFVLNLIASDKQIDAGHMQRVAQKTVDNYIFNESNASAFSKEYGIRSTLTKTPWDYTTDIVWVDTDLNYVVVPTDVLGLGATYVGSAVREMDRYLNANTEYHQDGNVLKPGINLY